MRHETPATTGDELAPILLLPMSLCRSSDIHACTKNSKLREQVKKALVLGAIYGEESRFSIDMANGLRRAGKRLKIMTKMNLWSRNQHRATDADSTKRCYLLELPTELLLEIISHLPVLSEACLALTCKPLFAISSAILESRSLHFNRDFAPLFHHYRSGHSFITTRWQFVKVLENSTWRACSKCLKLHPRGLFPSRELKRKPEERSCSLGNWAGIVDLCPCKKLTFRDKMELVELLLMRQKSVTALAAQFGAGVQESFCWHSCTETYGSTQLKVELFPALDENGQLKIKTEYRLSTESGQLGKEEFITSRFGCAHRSVDLWLSSVCQTTICQLHDSFCASCKRISICNTCNTALKCPRKQPCHIEENSGRVTYLFWTERCLGGTSSSPDHAWAAQRIHPAENTIGVDDCNELCPWTIREHPLNEPPALEMNILEPGMQDQSMNQLYASINMI